MNELAEALIDGLLEREEETGETINFGGEDYPCSGGAILQGKRLDIGGFQFHADQVIVVRKAAFTDGKIPVAKQRLTYMPGPEAEGIGLRIDGVRSLYGAVLVLECNDPNQGA